MDKLLKELGNRPIVIWGARITGIGFLRFAQKHNLNVIGFVDSDPSFKGTSIYGFPVLLPESLNNELVVVAVSTKEDEIIDSLKKTHKGTYINYRDFCKNFFTIDIAGMCNLRCPACATGNSPNTSPKGFMLLGDFKKIIDKIGLASHIVLYNWGEPLLHPQLDLFIDYAHQKGIAVAVSTNFSISSDISKIVKSSPDTFKISLSGYYPDTYNKTHTGGDINLVKSNLYKLKYYMEKYKSRFSAEVNYHLYKNNESEITKMKGLCEELGFIFSTCYANYTPIEKVVAYCEGRMENEKIMDLLPVSIEQALEATKPYHNRPCRFLSNQININWDRSVLLCCMSQQIISEDFLKDSLADIEVKKQNHPLCKKCMKYGIHQYYLGQWER